MFTVRSKEGPFTGKYWIDYNGNGVVDAGEIQTVQSEVAEVVWFLRPTLKADGTSPTDPPTFTLYRRVFLVLPTYQGNPVQVTQANYNAAPQNYDISLHRESGNEHDSGHSQTARKRCS